MTADFEEYLRDQLPRSVDDEHVTDRFLREMWRRIEAEEADQGLPAHGAAAGSSRGSGILSRVRAVLLPAAAAVAASAVALLLVGLPGQASLGPRQADAAQTALGHVYQGLGGLSTLSGRMEERSSGIVMAVSRFTLTHEGDARISTRHFWDRGALDPASPLHTAYFGDGEAEQSTIVRVRSLTTYDAQTHVLQMKNSYEDLATGRPWGTTYERVENSSSPALPGSSGDIVSGMPSSLRAWSGVDPVGQFLGITDDVSRESASGAMALHVKEQRRNGRVEYVFTGRMPLNRRVLYLRTKPDPSVRLRVDQQTGVTVAIASATFRGPSELTLTDVAVDRAPGRALFSMKPGWTIGRVRESGAVPTQDHSTLADHTRDGGTTFIAPSSLTRQMGYAPLVPAFVPAGFSLASVEVSLHGGVAYRCAADGSGGGEISGNDAPASAVLVYRKGLSSFRVSTMMCVGEGRVRRLSEEQGLAEVREKVGPNSRTIRHGYFSGYVTDDWEVAGRGRAVAIEGDLTDKQAWAILESLNPEGATGDYRPWPRTLLEATAIGAAGALAALLIVAAVRRRRRDPRGRRLGFAAEVALLGVSLTALGASLLWLGFSYGGDTVYKLSGWATLPGLTTATLAMLAALVAVAASLWPRRRIIWPARVAVVTLGLLGFALTLASLWLLPQEPSNGVESVLGFGPAVSALGTAVLVAGGALLRRHFVGSSGSAGA